MDSWVTERRGWVETIVIAVADAEAEKEISARPFQQVTGRGRSALPAQFTKQFRGLLVID
jgi:hypothetical protein